MASNNYYCYPHGATAYSSGYMAAQNVPTNYSGHGVSSYSTTARPPTSYDPGYSANPVASNYGYNSRPQHTGALAYASNSTQYTANNSAATMYSYASSSTPYTNTYNSVVSNYAASTLYTQQANVNQVDNSSTAVYTSGKPSSWNFKKTIKGNKLKSAPKVQQLHYCEVCKISCAGPQTYKEHLEGQRHKKKESQMKSGTVSLSNKRSQAVGVSLRCELCDITCTGNDAYSAHIRGSKHQKVLKLHTKLGKPIPNPDTSSIHPKSNSGKASTSNISSIPHPTGKVKVLGTPKINFMSGGRLQSSGTNENNCDANSQQENALTFTINSNSNNSNNNNNNNTNNTNNQSQFNQTSNQFQSTGVENNQCMDVDKSDCQPVGQDYVEEIKCEDNKSFTFYCKLCDCRFNDPNAKEMHLKGRRHRLQYKKKVDPNLIVDIKPSLKQRKIQETKERRFFHKQREHHYWSDWYSHPGSRYGYDGRHMLSPSPYPHLPLPSMITAHYRRGPYSNGSWDDNHILQRHSEISPSESELDDIHHFVMIIERALKLVSDKLEEDAQSLSNIEINKKETAEELKEVDNMKEEENKNSENKEKDESFISTNQIMEFDKIEENPSNRILKGLMRVGPLAKSLLLVGDKEVDLVVICADKPTKQLLQKIVDHLPKQLQSVNPSETFNVEMKLHEAGLSISSTNKLKIIVNVTFTSPLVRETNLPEKATLSMIVICLFQVLFNVFYLLLIAA